MNDMGSNKGRIARNSCAAGGRVDRQVSALPGLEAVYRTLCVSFESMGMELICSIEGELKIVATACAETQKGFSVVGCRAGKRALIQIGGPKRG